MSKKVAKQPTKQAAKQHQEVNVQGALSKSEEFFAKYKNQIVYCVISVIVIIGLGYAYQKFYREPKKEEAMGQMFLAEQAFRNDQFEIALNGDGNILGFIQVLEDYGMLSGKAIHLYIGICYLQLGENHDAIKALLKYRGKDFVTRARSYCCVGDAYANLGDLTKALEYYLKAANYHDNILAATYLKKAAIICEELGSFDSAIKYYQEIKDKYSQMPEAYEADKYISRLRMVMQK